MLSILIKPAKQKNFLVSLVYIPPSSRKEIAVEKIISLKVVGTSLRNAVRLIGGDFNMEAALSGKREKERALLNSIECKLNLKQLIKKPTRITSKVSSLIGLIFISTAEINMVQNCDSLDYNVSDHNLIWMAYK